MDQKHLTYSSSTLEESQIIESDIAHLFLQGHFEEVTLIVSGLLCQSFNDS